MKQFTGSMVAIVTPFKDGDVIDEEALCKLIDLQIAGGTSVIVPCGSTGESATLTHEEHEQVISLTVQHVAKRAKVLAGAGSNSTAEAERLTKFCHKAGADGVLHITPYYNKPTPAGLIKHFQAVAAAADLPVILYNVPGRTGVNMMPETVSELAQIENIVGIKEASGSLDQVFQIIQNTDDDFSMLSGDDVLTYPVYTLGGDGVISVTANIIPKKIAELCHCMEKNDWQKGLSLHQELYNLNEIMFIETNPIPIKAALSLMGHIEEAYRLPMVPASSQNRETIKTVLQQHGLLF